jgi:glycosyltransferase involved in cell wall biosynthesis
VAIENFDFSEFDIVVSISTCAAKAVVTRPATFHFSYVNTPIRYAWDFYAVYLKSAKPKILMKYAWPLFMHYLRNWDVTSANRADFFVGNSDNVSRRIRKYYRREAVTLYPPVDCAKMTPDSGPKGDYYFALSALVPYKRIDLAIKACRRLNRKLIIAGDGSEYKALKALAAGADVEFAGRVDDQQAIKLYQGARGFIFPGEEDFGITPLEAQACGTPVVAFGRGGALETIRSGEGGVFFSEQTEESLVAAMQEMEATDWSVEKMGQWVRNFSNECFRERFLNMLTAQYSLYRKNVFDEN